MRRKVLFHHTQSPTCCADTLSLILQQHQRATFCEKTDKHNDSKLQDVGSNPDTKETSESRPEIQRNECRAKSQCKVASGNGEEQNSSENKGSRSRNYQQFLMNALSKQFSLPQHQHKRHVETNASKKKMKRSNQVKSYSKLFYII